MKPLLKYFTSLKLLLILCLIFISTSTLSQVESAKIPAEFKIKIESTKKTIKLECISGCYWKELHYKTSSANILQSVNRYGMIDLTEREVLQSEDNNDFLFTIETATNTIKLKGIEGTAWKELSFDCFELRCIREFDSFGIARIIQ